MLTPTTEIEAVNTLLESIGESPVSNAEDNGNVDAIHARNVLRRTSREVQGRGWHFNTEKNYRLLPDTQGNIYLPSNVLRADTVGDSVDQDVVVRGVRLYNRKDHSYSFTAPVFLDMVVYLAFSELPEAVRYYIVCRATRIFQRNAVGSDAIGRYSERDEILALVALQDYEAETADYNVLTGSTSVSNVLQRTI